MVLREAPADALPVFEVCQPGVVLRALVGVQTVMALAVALQAGSLSAWSQDFLQTCVLSVPALLGWLLIVCLLRVRLAAWPSLRTRGTLLLLGAVCAGLPWWGWQRLQASIGLVPHGSLLQGVAVALLGALAANVLLAWLLLRARAHTPQGLQARYVELQSRIRPHFLFNTLNTAVALVRLNPQQAERVLEDLAELFRAALAAPGLSSTLGDEIRLARSYLDIEQLRFGERLRVEWQLEPGCESALLPPLALQPLVENAVRYGVEPNESGGDVLVRTRRRRGQGVELLVRNSLGASAPGGHGLALANVRERLALLHDISARFDIEVEPGRYTVRLTLPDPA